MYTETSLYYLQQMGIRPWISKQQLAAQSLLLDIEQIKLLVMCNTNENKAAETLLKQMLSSLNLNASEIKIISHDLSDSMEPDVMSYSNLKAILLFESDSHQSINPLNCHSPMFKAKNISQVLENPLEKRQIFQALYAINQLL